MFTVSGLGSHTGVTYETKAMSAIVVATVWQLDLHQHIELVSINAK